MSTTVELTFFFGRYHGTPWGRNVNEGAVDWPPAPWRLLRALMATWKAKASELDDATVVSLLGKLADPPRYWVPPSRLAHTRHYMPDKDYLSGSARGTDKVLDGFAAFSRQDRLYISWPADLSSQERQALRVLVERVGYLGRAESTCAGTVVDDPAKLPEQGWYEPMESEPLGSGVGEHERVLAAVRPLDLRSLAETTTSTRKHRRLVPSGARWVWYELAARPSQPSIIAGVAERPRIARETAVPTVVRWAFSSPAMPSLNVAIAMTDVLHQAAVSRFCKLYPDRASRQLTGRDEHGVPLNGHRHVHWLAFPAEQGGRFIDSLAAYAPAGLSSEEVAALCSLTQLSGYAYVEGFQPGRISVEVVGSAEQALPELVGPAAVWVPVTPFAPPKHKRPSSTLLQHAERYARRDLASLAAPAPARVWLSGSPGGSWLDFRRHRVRERLAEARFATGIKLAFDQPVQGPLLLGALRHFGLGLFRPDD
ncbi:MAG: type I-G CRISPR-associated protein Csb2 [Acidimicrobiales bacterium]